MEFTPEKVARLQELFEQALELAGAAREAFVAAIPGTDGEAMREEVRALLAAHDSGATLPESGLSTGASAASAARSLAGRRVGPWRVERIIGQGGMGTVCEAVRADAQFEKRVAIKFLHAHARHPAAERGFLAERQILASLDHPNVATMLDGGVTDEGQPYIVLEYIDGEPITQWADARGLAQRERVKLMLQVCSAVEAAHRRLIVHRDLKPGNILVTSDGRAKLLDFGIARLLGGLGTDPAGAQGGELRSFTPSHAAPEQLRGGALTTATDVFALGVVLYQLLTGRQPFASRVQPDEVAAPAGLGPDLDAILARALHVDTAQRYASVQELRNDLCCWLDDEPVLAHPGGPAYRIGKFLRRHRIGSALATVALAAILTASGVALWQARVAKRAAADQEELNAFLMDVLAMSDPFFEGEDITLSDALDRAAGKIDERFAGRPDLSAQVRYGIGSSMASRYRLEQAEEQLQRALAESITQFGAGDLRTLRVQDGIAGLRLEQGRLEEAKEGYLRVVAALEDRRATDTSVYVNALGNLGNVYLQQEDYAAADRVLQRALAANAERGDSGRAADQAGLLSNLAHAVHGLEDRPRASRHYTEAEKAFLALYPEGSPDLAILYNNHALLLEEGGDPDGALEMHQKSLAMRRKVFRNEHPMVVAALGNVARLQLRSGDMAGALAHAEEGAAMADRVYTAPNRFHPTIHATLADSRLALDDVTGAVQALRRARSLLESMGEDLPPSTARWVEEVGTRVCQRWPAACSRP